MTQPKKKRAGRKPEITEELMVRLETLLSNHNSIKTACTLSGIHQDTYHHHIEQSKIPGTNPLYTEFAERMTRARALGKANIIQKIAAAAEGPSGDWRALAWLAERTYREDFAPPERIEVNHGGKIQHDHTQAIHVHLPPAIAFPRPLPPTITIEARPKE